MEPALRIVTWTWLFHVFAHSAAWADDGFRQRFLTALYLHADFVERHLEIGEINGNHFTANATGLVFGGMFFGRGTDARRWSERGWRFLRDELLRQIHPDGVDFEASTAYHRLVTELFLMPALYRAAAGEAVPPWYYRRLVAAARFTAAYTKPDGSCPLWGDADDARTLPMRREPINDHRYLVGLVALASGDEDLLPLSSGPRSEALWLFGPEEAKRLPAAERPSQEPPSSAFRNAGAYVMRSGDDHVFIDCGPVGLAGRGGHGHNDALSFEAVLDGVPIITDCGSFVYTRSWEARNRFRATAAHNTPQVDGAELNRFDPDDLWRLSDDARPKLLVWQKSDGGHIFVGTHSGYERPPMHLHVERSIVHERGKHRLTITDRFEGRGEHEFAVPYHLAPAVTVTSVSDHLVATVGGRSFRIVWPADVWDAVVEDAEVSPSYGVAYETKRVVFRRRGGPASLVVTFEPA